MADRPILFSAPMVRAILNGSKTQTRRIVRPQPSILAGELLCWKDDALTDDEMSARCPYGRQGDRLWVRETFCALTNGWAYAADPIWNGPPADRWRPSIHMPRRASRITLEIPRVRVERLQDIGPEDAKAEGCHHDDPCDHKRRSCAEVGCPGPDYRIGFRNLWESINGPDSWAANPWVWVVDFKRITP